MDFLFLTAQSTASISKEQYGHNRNTIFQIVSYAQVTSSAKLYEKNDETENANDQSTEFQKISNLFKQINNIIEPCLANNSEFSDIEILKKVLHGYHAAFLLCVNFQWSLNTMQQYSRELQSAVT